MGSGRTAPPPPPPGAWVRHPRAGPRRAELRFLLAASLRAAPPLLRLLRRLPAPGRPDPAAHHPGGGSSRSPVALGSPPFLFYFYFYFFILFSLLSAHLPGLLGSPGWAAEAREEAGVATAEAVAATPPRGWPGFPAGGAPLRVRRPPW